MNVFNKSGFIAAAAVALVMPNVDRNAVASEPVPATQTFAKEINGVPYRVGLTEVEGLFYVTVSYPHQLVTGAPNDTRYSLTMNEMGSKTSNPVTFNVVNQDGTTRLSQVLPPNNDKVFFVTDRNVNVTIVPAEEKAQVRVTKPLVGPKAEGISILKTPYSSNGTTLLHVNAPRGVTLQRADHVSGPFQDVGNVTEGAILLQPNRSGLVAAQFFRLRMP